MDTILSVRDIRKTFGKVKAVDGVSFDVRRGSITGLLGRNGAGKTTTIRMITGIFHPDTGSIEWDGSSSKNAQDRLGYLPEERGLYKQMKVLEHLMFLAEIKSRKSPEVKDSAEKWLRRFELWEKKDAKVEELSKGNQQKVQLIGTLLHGPELIILDEPMSGLDPVNVVLVRNIIRELRDEGMTILLSTHMMGEAEKLADQIVLIHNGAIVLSGSIGEIKNREGENHVHVEFEGDGGFLSSVPGVEKATVYGSTAELLLAADADSQAVLSDAMKRLKIRRFEIGAPSLEEIFIRKVGADSLAPEEKEQLETEVVA
ncbi:MAG: ATP-binding cassette domain-containing protein [Acidobacteria bacterium]|nr:ATP-binding cassette domain-containing protein [Acidobacteriota bacterium]